MNRLSIVFVLCLISNGRANHRQGSAQNHVSHQGGGHSQHVGSHVDMPGQHGNRSPHPVVHREEGHGGHHPPVRPPVGTPGHSGSHVDMPGQHGNRSPHPVVHREEGHGGHRPPVRPPVGTPGHSGSHVDMPGQHGNRSPHPVVHREHGGNHPPPGHSGSHVGMPGQHRFPHPVVHREHVGAVQPLTNHMPTGQQHVVHSDHVRLAHNLGLQVDTSPGHSRLHVDLTRHPIPPYPVDHRDLSWLDPHSNGPADFGLQVNVHGSHGFMQPRQHIGHGLTGPAIPHHDIHKPIAVHKPRINEPVPKPEIHESIPKAEVHGPLPESEGHGPIPESEVYGPIAKPEEHGPIAKPEVHGPIAKPEVHTEHAHIPNAKPRGHGLHLGGSVLLGGIGAPMGHIGIPGLHMFGLHNHRPISHIRPIRLGPRRHRFFRGHRPRTRFVKRPVKHGHNTAQKRVQQAGAGIIGSLMGAIAGLLG